MLGTDPAGYLLCGPGRRRVHRAPALAARRSARRTCWRRCGPASSRPATCAPARPTASPAAVGDGALDRALRARRARRVATRGEGPPADQRGGGEDQGDDEEAEPEAAAVDGAQHEPERQRDGPRQHRPARRERVAVEARHRRADGPPEQERRGDVQGAADGASLVVRAAAERREQHDQRGVEDEGEPGTAAHGRTVPGRREPVRAARCTRSDTVLRRRTMLRTLAVAIAALALLPASASAGGLAVSLVPGYADPIVGQALDRARPDGRLHGVRGVRGRPRRAAAGVPPRAHRQGRAHPPARRPQRRAPDVLPAAAALPRHRHPAAGRRVGACARS